jgi:hypothetical protein
MQLRSALFLVGEDSEKAVCFFQQTDNNHTGAGGNFVSNGYQMSLRAIAKVLGVTTERVRQIESKALKKLQHPKNSKLIKPFQYS